MWHVYENNSSTPTATYSYDDNSNRSSLAYANGDTTTYQYNLANKLTQLANKKSATVLSQYTYTYYLNGNQANKTDSAGKANDYIYDGLGRVSAETETVSGNVTSTAYSYDDANNRKTMIVTGANPYNVTYAYDSNNRLTKEIKVTGVVTQKTTYSYDDNGNQICNATETTQPTVAGQQEGFAASVSGQSADSSKVTINNYDGFNQLIRTTVGDKTLTYTYDGNGLRASKTVNGVITNHVWDGDQIVLETDGSGILKAKYIRGVNLLASEDEMAVRKYFNYNGHGDVVQLAGTDGNVAKSYDYDAFGVEKNPDVHDTNVFRYSGEYFDKETGTIYLRARYYDPATSRMLTEDSYPGDTKDPLSLNLYVYCGNDPINMFDPSGHIPTADEAAAMAKNVYTVTNDYTGKEVSDKWIFEYLISNADTGGGLKMGVYSRIKDDGTTEYALVNKGSSTLGNWGDNF